MYIFCFSPSVFTPLDSTAAAGVSENKWIRDVILI